MSGPSVVVQVTLVLELPQVKGGASSKEVKSSLIWEIRGLHRHTLYLVITMIIITGLLATHLHTLLVRSVVR